MKCPKCGFEGTGEECLKCGVVFSKLNAPSKPRSAPVRPVPPRLEDSFGTTGKRFVGAPPPSPRSPSFSLLNTVALTCLLIIVGVTGWRWLGQTEPESETKPAPSVKQPPKREWSGLDNVPDRSPGDGAGEAIVLPDLAPNRSEDDVAPPSSDTDDSRPEIPYFDQTNISPRLVSELVELSRQYPGDESVRRSVARAYLALSYRMFTAERYQESLDLAAVAGDWDAPPRDVARVSAQSCLELRDLAGAMEWAQSALTFGPDADMYDVLGEVYYRREDMGRAVEAWRQALAMREDPEIRAALEKALREMQVADGYDRQRLSHFIVKYEGESMEETGRMVLRSLERSYSYLKSTLSFEPAEPIVIILYSRREYAELGGPDWSAGYFDGKVRVPVRGLVSLDKHVEATLRHELTHAFIYARAGDNCPRWLHEGVAEYCEGVRSERFGNVLAQKIEADGDFSYCVIGQRCDVRYFYPAATSVVEYMMKVRGMGGIRDLLGYLGAGKTIDQALQEVTGRDELGLMNEWQRFMRRRYL